QRTDIKPSGWELDNPLAPATVTSDIYSRWSEPGGRDPSHPYAVGQKVTKDMAAYWEVYLTKATESELLQYDVLFVTNHRLTSMTPQDREKLRKVVDAGGVVWLDDCGGMRIGPSGRFFLEELQFRGTTTGLNNSPGPALYQPTHPLLNSPYTMSYNDILTLGDKGYGNHFHATIAPNAVTTDDIVLTAPNKETLTTIIGNRQATDGVTNLAMPYISAGVYGSGSVIVTSADIGCGVNDYSGGFNAGSGGNSGAYAGKNLLAANSEDLKFVYNAISWGGSNNTVRRNNRRTASSTSAVTAPLNQTFDFANTPTNRVVSKSAPLISQGIMYVSGMDAAGNATLRAYDTVPNRDFDNDGNYDDGRPDLVLGTPYDEIWRWNGPAAAGVQPSAPVLATITDASGIAGDVILITLGDGTLKQFIARPLDPATRRVLPAAAGEGTNAAETAAGYVSATNGVAPSPVFFNNKIYVVEANGLVRCVNAADFTTAWRSTDAAVQYQPTGTPTLGLNRLVVNKVRDLNQPSRENTIAGNTNESTNDVMLYVPVLHPADSSAKVLAYWLGSRNEGTKDATVVAPGNTTGTLRLRPASTNVDQYYISKGGGGFITPSLSLYADVTFNRGTLTEITYTREENFAAGRAVWPVVDPFFVTRGYPGTWNVTFQNSILNPGFFSGQLDITYNGDSTLQYSNLNRVLAVANYDLVYVPVGGAGGTPPPYLTSTPGHRNAAPLTIQRATGLDTVAFAPNDLLLYGANQANEGGTLRFGALFGMQEREFSLSASRLRWRYLLHQGYQGQVGGVTVNELPALRNRMIFTGTNPLDLQSARLIEGDVDNDGVVDFYESLLNANIVGSPITTNDGITYVVARAESVANGTLAAPAPVTVLMAFQTVPQITLDLGVPIDSGSAVTVSQWDPLNGTAGGVVSTSGDPNDRTRVDVDYKTGRLTIADFGALNNGTNLFSASSSFVVTYNSATGGNASTPQTKVISPYGPVQNVSVATNPNSTGDVLDNVTGASSSGGFTPLLWYYVLPGAPQASPTKIGDQIFLTIENRIIAVDADPASNDPTLRLRSGEQAYGVVDNIEFGLAPNTRTRDISPNHVRWNNFVGPGLDASSPGGGEGSVAINTTVGTFSYSEGLTVIADATRILEVNADGGAVLAITGTTEVKTAGGAAPIYLADGSLDPSITTQGRTTLTARPFSLPQSVRRLSSSEYLVADSGNNRVVRIDRGGNLRWSVERLNDPYGLLAPGDPQTLNTPTDVLTRQLSSFTGGNRVGFETHYLIADSGNGRIIDVVDYFDLDGRPRVVAGGQSSGIVVWTTRTKSQNGENLAYHNLQLIAGRDPGPDNTLGTGDDLAGKPILVASVSNSSVSSLNNNDVSNASGGSLVQLDYNPYNTGFVLVNVGTGAFTGPIKYYWAQEQGLTLPYNPTSMPAPQVPEPLNNGKELLAINDLRLIEADVAVSVKRLNAPTYFEQIPLDLTGDGIPESVYLIADADGVYACVVRAVAGKSYFDILWRFQQDDYDVINRTRFVPSDISALPRLTPSSVKRLANGQYMITNSAAGASGLFQSGQFLGEVFTVSLPLTGAFDVNPADGSVRNTIRGGTYGNFSTPRIQRGKLVGPTVPVRELNRQQMGRDTNGASLTEQPRSADRL
ncbi:MAG: hypothetical protein H7145_10830, partial [Akkermansiaceae bacterium]|nr:hypothetical protein [Armatimonadota bacterium]